LDFLEKVLSKDELNFFILDLNKFKENVIHCALKSHSAVVFGDFEADGVNILQSSAMNKNLGVIEIAW
jgi:hypothetical protein